MNSVNELTTPILERHLAVIQIKHYLHLKQCAIDTGDKVEYRRTTDILDRLTTEYGLSALYEAHGDCRE